MLPLPDRGPAVSLNFKLIYLRFFNYYSYFSGTVELPFTDVVVLDRVAWYPVWFRNIYRDPPINRQLYQEAYCIG